MEGGGKIGGGGGGGGRGGRGAENLYNTITKEVTLKNWREDGLINYSQHVQWEEEEFDD